MAAIDIGAYLDYRAFLRDALAERKARDPKYSLRYYAGRLGVDSALLVRILQGTRRLSLPHALRLAGLLGLDEAGTERLQNLVLYGHSRGHAESRRHLEKLLAGSSPKLKRLAENQFEYFSRWYLPALRELIHARGFDGDYRRLGRRLRPPVGPAEAKRAVEALLELGLLKRKAGGRLELAERHVEAPEAIRPVLVHAFQLAMMDLAKEAIDRFAKEVRDISTLTFSLSGPGFAKIQEVVREFRAKVVDIVDTEPKADRVYQLNLQLFPLSASAEEEKDET